MRKNQKNRKTKTTLVFDENARKEWLQGFSKRKKERQQKAKDDLAALLKQEQKRQKDEHRELVKRNESKYLEKLNEVEEIVKEKTSSYECGGKTVEITEYNLTNQDSLIGTNQGDEDEKEGEDNVSGSGDKDNVSGSGDTDNDDVEESTSSNVNMPRKPTRTAIKIEKRLYKLTHKKNDKSRKNRERLSQNSGKRIKSTARGKLSKDLKLKSKKRK